MYINMYVSSACVAIYAGAYVYIAICYHTHILSLLMYIYIQIDSFL
jgi:hypothetical protein